MVIKINSDPWRHGFLSLHSYNHWNHIGFTFDIMKIKLNATIEIDVKILRIPTGFTSFNYAFIISSYFFYFFLFSKMKLSVRFIVLNATFNNISVISWRSVVLVEETGKNHRPVASHWQTLSHYVVSSTPRHDRDSNSQL
jgi:hypothetical protein